MARSDHVLDGALAPEATSIEEVGGKGFNLLRLRSLGLAVPRFVIVTRGAFDAVLGRRLGLADCLPVSAGTEPADLAAAAARIAGAVRAAGCPDGLERELRAALEDAGLGCARLAVRSSVVGEDSAAHSFAGLMETRLEVPAARVASALVEVWASAFSDRALAYRLRKGLGSAPIGTAVVVQQMVRPSAAGVLFTRDPQATAAAAAGEPVRRCLVSAAFGLGESVVAGAVDADNYRIAWDGEAVERETGSKASRRVAAPSGGTKTERLPARLRHAAVLDDSQVRALRDLGVALERALGAPQDVEWAFDEGGTLFVLQSRPIAAAAAVATRGNGAGRRVWDNANIVESYPGITLPLTFSFVREAYERAFRGAAAAFFPVANPLAERPELFKSLVGLLRGRVYYNLLGWYEMFSYLSRPERHRERWDRMVGVAGGARVPAPPRSLGCRLLAALGTLRVILGVRRHARAFRSRFDAFYSRHRDAAAAPGAAALAASFRRIEAEASRFWHLTLFADLCAMRYHDWLAALAARWAPDVPDLANRLLRGLPGVESVAPVRHLVALAERVRREPRWRNRLRRDDDAAVWRSLGEEPALAPLREALEEYLEAFGDRGVEELKLETPSFRERPERVVALLRGYVDGGLGLREMDQREAAERAAAERAAAERIAGWRRLVFRRVLARAREAIRSRENMRFARSRLFGIVRRVFHRLGEELAADGALERADDVFYLTTAEALGFVEATAVDADLRALVALRRRAWARFAEEDLPDRFETAGLPSLAAVPEPPARARAGGRRLTGIGCSAGVATGSASVVRDPAGASPRRGDILVARSTDPGWVFLMLQASGLVAERGSPLSHTAIIGRELGIPTVVGALGATARIPDGARMSIDGGSGRVEWT